MYFYNITATVFFLSPRVFQKEQYSLQHFRKIHD